MLYKRIFSIDDPDIPYLTMILKLPEIARFISIDEKNYWKYVTSNENVFYFKAYEQGRLVGATHCEIVDHILYMDIMIIPTYQRKGFGETILQDIQNGKLPLAYDQIEVSIEDTNEASIKLFEKMNFHCVSKEEELLNYRYLKN